MFKKIVNDFRGIIRPLHGDEVPGSLKTMKNSMRNFGLGPIRSRRQKGVRPGTVKDQSRLLKPWDEAPDIMGACGKTLRLPGRLAAQGYGSLFGSLRTIVNISIKESILPGFEYGFAAIGR